MPKVTTLPFISSGTTATSFLVIDEKFTRRIQYNDLVGRIVDDVQLADFRGPAGPAGPASSIAGPVGPTGPTGIGLPIGGLTGQVLAKVTDSDYIVGWTTVTGGSGTGEPGEPGVGVPAGGTAGQVLAKMTDSDYNTEWVTPSNSGGLASRTLSSAIATTVAPAASATVEATGFKSYMLLKVTTDYPAWVVIYSDEDSRTADAGRISGTDPLPGSGVIAEIITTPGNLTQLITPGVIGFNNSDPVSSVVYLKVKNNDSVTRSIQVTLSLLQLED
jgi:hypothetical protein